jgi:excisionase family DNA binding protein
VPVPAFVADGDRSAVLQMREVRAAVSDALARALLDAIAADPEAVERLRTIVGVREANGPEAWIGVADAAAHLGCKRQRIYDLVHSRAIPHRKEGSRLLFRRSQLNEWLDGRAGL